MKCPKCDSELKKISVKIAGAEKKVVSFQCTKCDYFEFEKESSHNVISELRESPLKINQKIIKLSGGRLGFYFNKNIINSLGIKGGNEILVSVPDKKHILLEIK